MQQSLTNISVLPQITIAETAMPGEAVLSVFASRPSASCATAEQQTLILAITPRKGVRHYKKKCTQQHTNTRVLALIQYVHMHTPTHLHPLHLPNDLNTSGPAYFPSK